MNDSGWVVFNELPVEPVRLAWCEWMRHHSVDPNDVACPGWIERDVENRRIRFEAYALDKRGRLRLDQSGDDALREVRVVQLEAAPSPFPGVVIA